MRWPAISTSLSTSTAFLLSAVLSACNSSPATLDAIFSAGSSNGNPANVGNSSVQVGSPGYDFGTVSVGVTPPPTATIPIKNLATSKIYLQTISIAGNTNYSLASSTCPKGINALAPGTSCSVVLQFAPTVSGVLPYALQVNYGIDGAAYPFHATGNITGTGLALLNFAGVNAVSAQQVSTTKVGLTWTPISGATSYTVYKAVLGNTLAVDSFVPGATTASYTVGNLAPNTTYIFEVKALNALSQEDANTVQQQVTTNAIGSFTSTPTLSTPEGSTVVSSDLSSYCTDLSGHTPSYMAVATQTDSDAQCTMLTSPFRVQCAPNFKSSHSAWSATLSLNCLLNDYPNPLSQTMTLLVSPFSITRSTLVLSPSGTTVQAGSTANLVLTTVDASGNPITRGGLPLGGSSLSVSAFGGTSTISLGTLTDNQNGTYSIPLTGVTSGTAITYAMQYAGKTAANSVSVSTIPGAVTQSTSTVTSSSTTLEADGVSTSTVTVTALDANSNGVSGKTIALTSNQADAISPASATTNASGVATFTVLSSSAHTSTYTATDTTDSLVFNASSAQHPQIVYSAMIPSLTSSTVTASSASILKGQTSTVTLTVKNKNSVVITTAAQTVTFATSGGTSVLSAGSVVNNGNGTYSIVYTGSSKGTALTITPSIGGIGTVGNTTSITVANTAPVLSGGIANSSTTYSYPLNGTYLPLVQGTTYTLASGTDVDTGDTVTWTCTYQTLGLSSSDPNYAASGTACTSLASMQTGATNSALYVGTIATGSSSITWTPTNTQRGTYAFSLQPTDSTTAGATTTLYVTVRENDTTNNQIYGIDALLATNVAGMSSSSPAGSFTNNASAGGTNWLDLLDGSHNGTITSATWYGTGTAASPYTLKFNGTSSNMDLGSAALGSSNTKFAVEAWVQPATVASPSAGNVIASNGGGTGNGFVMRQSTRPYGKAEFVVGSKYYSYRDLILSDGPVSYWRLSDTTTSAVDLGTGGNTGTYYGTLNTNYWQSQTGALTNDTNTAAKFDGSSGYIQVPNNASLNTSTFSVEFWAYVTGGSGTFRSPITYRGQQPQNIDSGFTIYANNSNQWSCTIGVGGSSYVSAVNTAVTLNTWTYVVLTYDGATLKCYVNAAAPATASTTSYVPNTFNSLRIAAGATEQSATFFMPGYVDEVAVYNTALTATQITNHYQTGYASHYVPYPGNAVLADKPTGYWRLNETSGTTANDLSGNGYNGTYIGSPTFGQSGPLSGSGDSSTSTAFTTTSGVSSPLTSTTVTNTSIEAWFNPANSSQAGCIASLGNCQGTSGQSGYSLYFSNGSGAAGSAVHIMAPYISWSTTGGAATVTANAWHHAVAVYTGTTWYLYIDGSLSSSSTSNTANPPTSMSSIGGVSASTGFTGNITEVAFYNYALTATQVANHYNSGNGPGWWYCQSKTALNSSNWNLLTGLYDSVTGVSQLYVNGQQECSVKPATANSGWTYTASTNDVFAGSTPTTASSFWQGVIAMMKFFGTTNGVTTPLPSPSVAADFAAEANRFRATPVENIVTNGLVLNLDAANAQQGTTTYASGCASSVLSWFDMSGNAFNGTLTGFSGCTTTDGWQGAGTTGSPYVLALNGSSDFVSLVPSNPVGLAAFTVTMWQNTSTFGGTGNERYVVYYVNSNNYYVLATPGGLLSSTITYAGTLYTQANVATIPTNAWHHLAMTFASGSSPIVYLDGTAGSTANTNGWSSNATSPVLAIGHNPTGTQYNKASIATVQIYSTTLTAAQIKQNCLAQEHRFTSTSQSICGSP